MRILHVVTNADLGGAPRVVTELANRAVREGNVVAAASVPEGPFWEHLDPSVERLPLHYLRREIRPWSDFMAVLELRRLFTAWRPEIIHLHSSKAGVLGRLAAGSRAACVVYTIHGFDTILKRHRVFLPLERLLARRCGAVVPVSSYDRKNLLTAKVRGTIVLIPNGVSDRRGAIPLNRPVAEKISAARDSGARVVLSIARLAPPKRFDLFLEAAQRLEAENFQFFWIGNPDLPQQNLLPPNVTLLGELPEAGDYTGLCDIFLLLSDYEGLPMSILEALSAGRPVVASAVGGVPEAVDGTIGALVRNEAEEITAALRELVRDPIRLDRAGQAARRRYEERFSVDAMWQGYARLYEKLGNASPERNIALK